MLTTQLPAEFLQVAPTLLAPPLGPLPVGKKSLHVLSAPLAEASPEGIATMARKQKAASIAIKH